MGTIHEILKTRETCPSFPIFMHVKTEMNIDHGEKIRLAITDAEEWSMGQLLTLHFSTRGREKVEEGSA